MYSKRFLSSLQSFVVLPILATNLIAAPVGVAQAPTAVVSSSDQNGPHISTISDNQQVIDKNVAQKIDTYFMSHGMPLAGLGMQMVEVAQANNLDPYLIPAIAVRESSGGKHACKNVPWNAFGWGSCQVSFKSYQDAITTIASNLGGNNPVTAYHYDDKTTREILDSYNPPSIVHNYTDQVLAIMKDMQNTPVLN